VEAAGRRYVSVEQIPLSLSIDDNLRTKPFLKWAGGKTHLLPVLRQCVPKTFRWYFEPFLGGAALFFDLGHSPAVLSDSNEELVQCYEVVRDKPEELLRQLAEFRVTESEFYRVRAIRPETLPAVTRAARFIYLNRTCYNGL
jgi:DNA adenine methylase